MSDSTPDRRQRWRKYHELQSAVHQQWQERGYRYPSPATPPFPDDLRKLACGARTTCKLTAIDLNGRCKWQAWRLFDRADDGSRQGAIQSQRQEKRKAEEEARSRTGLIEVGKDEVRRPWLRHCANCVRIWPGEVWRLPTCCLIGDCHKIQSRRFDVSQRAMQAHQN